MQIFSESSCESDVTSSSDSESDLSSDSESDLSSEFDCSYESYNRNSTKTSSATSFSTTTSSFTISSAATSPTDISLTNTSLTATSSTFASSTATSLSGESIEVPTTEERSEPFIQTFKSIHNKKHACFFCGKLFLKISRHALLCHKSEPDIIQILLMTPNTQQRKDALAKIRNKGDYKHNIGVLRNKKGMIIPKVRPKAVKNFSEYLPCIFCHAMFTEKDMINHTKRCKFNEIMDKPLPFLDKKLAVFYSDVVLKMRHDDITETVKNDDLIISYGKKKYFKKSCDLHTSNIVSLKMRELGRLVILGNKKGLKSVSDFLLPENFKKTINTVKELCEYDYDSREYKKTRLVLSIGHSLNKCAEIYRSKGAISNDKEKKEIGETFSELYASNWNNCLSAGALLNIHVNKIKLLPFCKDVITVYEHIKQTTIELFMLSKLTESNYEIFAKYTLCLITMFNCKRGGEVQRLKIKDLKKITEGNTDEEILKSLLNHERRLCKVMSRIEICDKFGKLVALLLTPQMVSNLDKIKKYHIKLNIHSEYVFSRPKNHRLYCSPDVLREIINQLTLERLNSLMFSYLRKHIATISQVSEMSTTNKDQLDSFLGFDQGSVYQLPLDIIDQVKISKLLLMIPEANDESSVQDWQDIELSNNG